MTRLAVAPADQRSSPDGVETAAGRRRASRTIEWSCVVGIMLLLSLGLTWPLPLKFRTQTTGVEDSRHIVWLLWHTREALLGRASFYETPMLYFPHGTSLIALALGPAAGVLALPFFPLGPVAAYNGSLLLGFVLSGCAAYGLARAVRLPPSIALFAAVVYVSAPIHLSAAYGHYHKAFVAALPLIVLATLRALDVSRSLWWAVAGAGAMLLALLQSGEQFVFGGIAIGLLAGARLLGARTGERWRVGLRAVLLAGLAVVLAAPILRLIVAIVIDPRLEVARADLAPDLRPDLVQLFVPSWSSRLFAAGAQAWLRQVLGEPPRWTDVSIPAVVTLLCVVAAFARPRRARLWLVLGGLFAAFALGPFLGVLGRTSFPLFGGAIPLPFAALSRLPGLSVIRATDRFMLMAFVGLAIGAGLGLEWLCRGTRPAARRPIAALAIGLVLVEVWPRSWPQEPLPRVPVFYEQIASDPDVYGVFDVPIRDEPTIDYMHSYVTYSADYELMQITHGKGIASGYLAREFYRHPVFASLVSNGIWPFGITPDMRVNGKPANRFANARYEMARNGYRYLVRHKTSLGEGRGAPSRWAQVATTQLIAANFAGETPIVDDARVAVYDVGAPGDVSRLVPTIALQESWVHGFLHQESKARWAMDPAPLYVASPVAQAARLAITPLRIYDPAAGELPLAAVTLETATGPPVTETMRPGVTTEFPLQLSAGSQVVTLRIENPTRRLPPRSGVVRFALGTIDLLLDEARRSVTSGDGQVRSVRQAHRAAGDNG